MPASGALRWLPWPHGCAARWARHDARGRHAAPFLRGSLCAVALDSDPRRKRRGDSREVGPMSVIVAASLTQRFGSEVGLDGVDLDVDAGEHLAVLGDNGAGKTTLLRILATAARPTSGRIEIFGLNATIERRRLRGVIGFVAHAPGLYPALSAAENLEFYCTLQGVDRRLVAEVLELVGLAAPSSGWRSAGRSSTTPSCSCWTSPTRASTLAARTCSRASCGVEPQSLPPMTTRLPIGCASAA